MKLRFYTLLMAVCTVVLCVSCNQKNNQDNANLNSVMKYRPLGNTGLEVSELSIGCAAFEDMTKEESYDFMSMVLDSGMNYIDIYDADPKVRDNIGYALKDRRDRMIIQGHIGCYFDGEQYQRTREIDKAKIGFEDLLQRLGTDHIEVGMLHFCDELEDLNDLLNGPLMTYAEELKASGKIKSIGISSHNAEVALAAVKSGKIEVLMFSINPAYDALPAGLSCWDTTSYKQMMSGIDPVRVELYDYCTTHGIAITVMKTFGGAKGMLLDAKRSPLKVALTPVQCLSYVLNKACVATAVCGAKTKEELLADLQYLHATDAEKDYSSVLNGNKGKTGSENGQCTYCNHCLPCPVGIDIAKVNELLDKATEGDKVPEKVASEYKSLKHKAGECTQCGACEGRCPFAVSVRERMKEAQRVFGE